MPRPFRRRVPAGLVLAAAALALPATATAAAEREVIPIASTSSQPDVVSSVVRLRVPMLPEAAPHPAACDWIAYQRWQSASGPADPTQADAVTVLFPGILEGATAFDAVARNTIREAARRGRKVEVWGIDRRSNCLEDHTGVDAATASGDPQEAVDYYYRGKVIGGRRFAGFAVNDRVLADIGVNQTMHDYHAVLTNELPDQAWREKHVICGGHSMGGPLTDLYAGWDFDGDKATTADAGYRQCAGYVGFDTILNAGSADARNTPSRDLLGQLTGGFLGSISKSTVSALKAGLIPRGVNLFGINPESMNALELIASLAERDPDGEATALLRQVPRTRNMEDFLHLAGSPDLLTYLTSPSTSIRRFRYTNMALLGQVMDDNGGAYGLVRTSFGYFDGAPLRRNRLPEGAGLIPGLGFLVSPGRLMMPLATNPQGLTTWRNYDDLGANTASVTSPGEEVTDARQFARAIHEGPLNLTENYFPIRLVVDSGLLAVGDRTGGLRGSMHGNAITGKPRVAVISSGGRFVGERPVDPRVLAQGYEHLDVLTAAERQNDGEPEVSSQTLADLIDTAVPR